MEIKPLHFVIALLAVFAVGLYYFFSTQEAAPAAGGADLAQELFMKAASLGESANGYVYAYAEYSDGFPENYTLAYDGKLASVKVESPLSLKEVRFLGNDTVFCITFNSNETCASVENESAAKSYVASMRSRLFDYAAISAAKADTAYRLNRSLQAFSPSLRTKLLQNGKECISISYTIDYRNATLQELNRFGIGSGSPSVFDVSECIDNATGEIYEYRLDYTYQGKRHYVSRSLIRSDFAARPAIAPPQGISGGALDIAFSENAYKGELLKCYQQSGSEQEKCIALVALALRSKGLCSYAGAREDRCLVSLVPVTKDASICPLVVNPSFKDDCYIELGGAYKNSTWCDSVEDAAKKDYCLQVSSPAPYLPVQDETGNGTPGTENATPNAGGNETVGMPEGVVQIFGSLEYENATNITAGANGSGGG